MDIFDKKLENLDRKIDAQLDGAESVLEKHLDAAGLGAEKENVSTSLPRSWKLPAFVAPEPLAMAGMFTGLETKVEDLLAIAAHVFNSSHVQSNEHYRDVAASTSFVPDLSNNTVNAYASHGEYEMNGYSIEPPVIVLLGGAVNATRLASLALAADDMAAGGRRIDAGKVAFFPDQKFLPSVMQNLGHQIVKGRGELGLDDVGEIVEQVSLGRVLSNEEALRKARDYAAGMHLGIIAHEMGHIAYGHTLGQRVNLEVSRNQEREADLFASSVVSSSFFGEYLVTGIAVWWIILAWVEHAGGDSIATTHPCSAERLLNFIRDNKAQAGSIGITHETIKDYLPEKALNCND